MNEIKIRRCITYIGRWYYIKVGFIGPGKVGVNLGRYFTHKGISLSGFYGKSKKHTLDACKITNSKFYNNLKEIINDSDILFITTPDDYISTIGNQISKFNLKHKSVCHTSGSLKSSILSNAKLSGAHIYSIHPIFAFSNKNINLNDLNDIYFSIEGDLDNTSNEELLITYLMHKIGNNYFVRDIKDSYIYHLANVFVSNFVLSLLNIGINYLEKLGLNEKEAIEAFKPLIQGNINHIFESGFEKSLSGPVLRGDINTIKNHLKVIDARDKYIYSDLSLNLLNLIAKREIDELNLDENKEKDPQNQLMQLLNNSYNHNEIFNLLGGLK